MAAVAAFYLGMRRENERWRVLFFTGRQLLGEDLVDPEELADHLAQAWQALQGDREETKALLRRLERTLDALEEGILLLDREGKPLYMNRQAALWWGELRWRRLGAHHVELFPYHTLNSALSASRREGTVKEVIQPLREGPLLESRFIPLAEGGLLVVQQDIRERRAVERMRREFVANASHELRTPLMAIQGYAEELLDQAEEKERRPLERILWNTQHMARIIEDMLLLARVESFEQPFHLSPLDLARLVEEEKPFYEDLFRNLTLETQLEEAFCLGDPVQLGHVLRNLLSNAAHYTPEGGRVWVRTGIRQDEEGKRWARLEVEDTGLGVPAEDREKIFERFYRVDRGRSRQAGGTGLGLAIVKHIVGRHDGRVWVEGRAGEPGSLFVVEIPFQKGPHGG
ncbi:MAG: ATP-binding protein [Bacillota bacterium]|nr:ATP-binding protein [Bacillota bacterium]